MNENELLNNSRVLNNSADMLRDILNGDTETLKKLDSLHLDTEAIKIALDFLLNNRDITDKEKTQLISNTWAVNFKAKPPTPEEFLTPEYLGPAALHTYDRVKKVFFEFMDPKKDYRHLILYPHISWGKPLQYDELIATPKGKIPIKDIQIGDEVCTPSGKISHVINKEEFPEEKVYRIRFEDGRVIKACEHHNWKASYDGEWKVVTTEYLYKTPYNWYIPITQPVYHEEKKHLVSPRVLGILLRNKKVKKGSITNDYKYDSIKNRRELLESLLGDSNIFSSLSEKLIDDVIEVACGLGASSCIKKKEGDFYSVTISYNSNICHISSIVLSNEKGGVCIETDDEERLFLAGKDYIVTHNSYLSAVTTLYVSTCVSLMRNPWKYFGLNPATILTQMLCSYSLKKSSELLLEPFFNLLESSPYFEKVRTREDMAKKEKEFQNLDTVDRIYYTTAAPTSDIAFSGGCNIKCVSNPQGLLGATIITIALSELAFFTDAGKALDLDERIIMADGTFKCMRDIKIGDKLLSPTTGISTVTDIPWQGEDDLYEIEISDGRTVRCNAKHLWPVTYYFDGEYYDEIVDTQFMVDHPNIEFDIKEFSNLTL